jgi:UDP-N-acetyl-2-amino-2-deoxyglucuronate dehydrogenase
LPTGHGAAAFGRLFVAVNVFWTRPQSYYDSAAWRSTWEFDGGAFMNQAATGNLIGLSARSKA